VDDVQNRGVDTLKNLEELEKRLDKLEKREFEDTLTLVEILSNIAFFSSLKMKKCRYATDGQCELFFLRREAKKKIPIATDCRIRGCEGEPSHCHLELSKITCALCPNTRMTKIDSRLSCPPSSLLL